VLEWRATKGRGIRVIIARKGDLGSAASAPLLYDFILPLFPLFFFFLS